MRRPRCARRTSAGCYMRYRSWEVSRRTWSAKCRIWSSELNTTWAAPLEAFASWEMVLGNAWKEEPSTAASNGAHTEQKIFSLLKYPNFEKMSLCYLCIFLAIRMNRANAGAGMLPSECCMKTCCIWTADLCFGQRDWICWDDNLWISVQSSQWATACKLILSLSVFYDR